MKQYVFYDENGRILWVKRIQADMVQANANGAPLWLETTTQVDPNTQYIADGNPASRPQMSLSYSTLSVKANKDVVITGLPGGTEVLHPDGLTVVNDGQLEWSSSVAGVYRLRFMNFPYQDEEVSIEVTS